MFAQATAYARQGGTVDITCCLGPRDGIATGLDPVEAVLGLTGRKGCIAPGADADLVLLDADDRIETVIARGRVALRAGKPVLRGMFEA